MGRTPKIEQRLGKENNNYQGCLMKIVEYNDALNTIVEFQDEYKCKVHAQYRHFLSGQIKNPYYPSVYGVGIVGNKYINWVDRKPTKEYHTWYGIIQRCYDKKTKQRHPTYEYASCCDEWLLFENFYEWLHNQPNFDKWYNGDKWEIDKDILVKGNKVYSPDTCCLMPKYVNSLFTNRSRDRGELPIGVTKHGNSYRARCNNPFTNKSEILKNCKTPEQAFQIYKLYKENVIKQIASIEYNKGNITKACYDAMMKYEVEITD